MITGTGRHVCTVRYRYLLPAAKNLKTEEVPVPELIYDEPVIAQRL
jgi:hypothetical protein